MTILRSFKENQIIQTIVLDDNDFGNLPEKIPESQGLLARNSNLLHISLSKCLLGDSIGKHIFEILKENKELISIRLQKNSLSVNNNINIDSDR